MRIQRLIDSLPPQHDLERVRRMSQLVPYGQAEQVRRMTALLEQAYSPRHLRAALEQLAQLQHLPGSGVVLADAATQLEHEIEAAGDLPADGSRTSLGWWLATRPLTAQLALLATALGVVEPFATLIEDTTGENVPDSVVAGVQVCIAIVAFLLVWLRERDQSG